MRKDFCRGTGAPGDSDHLDRAVDRLVRENLELLIKNLQVTLDWHGNKLVANLFDGVSGEVIRSIKIENHPYDDAVPGTFGHVPLMPIGSVGRSVWDAVKQQREE